MRDGQTDFYCNDNKSGLVWRLCLNCAFRRGCIECVCVCLFMCGAFAFNLLECVVDLNLVFFVQVFVSQ